MNQAKDTFAACAADFMKMMNERGYLATEYRVETDATTGAVKMIVLLQKESEQTNAA
ncbi:hypothetical protein [Paraburkholderia sediminicola]|uniref:hypothetical protein n=1 Tax=Paraburkholderia sediminicola TaxID=458836 RepID=UPI0038BA4AEE